MLNTNHNSIEFDKIKIIVKTLNYYNRMVGESIEIRKNPITVNKDSLDISCTCISIINVQKKCKLVSQPTD